jgi:hypothetical protein
VLVYIGNVLSLKLAELLSIAGDASITRMYAPGTRRHIKAALRLSATVEEIMEILKVCVAFGVQASNLGVYASRRCHDRAGRPAFGSGCSAFPSLLRVARRRASLTSSVDSSRRT